MYRFHPEFESTGSCVMFSPVYSSVRLLEEVTIILDHPFVFEGLRWEPLVSMWLSVMTLLGKVKHQLHVNNRNSLLPLKVTCF